MYILKDCLTDECTLEINLDSSDATQTIRKYIFDYYIQGNIFYFKNKRELMEMASMYICLFFLKYFRIKNGISMPWL